MIYKDFLCLLKKQQGIDDYKFFTFAGSPRLILVCKGRFSATKFTEDFFDTEWNHLDVKREKHAKSITVIKRPMQLDFCKELASKLTVNIPFARVDFYIVGCKVYFGELTFYPASGFERFEPSTFDNSLGAWITV